MAESVSLPRFRSLLMSVFAATALLLAAVGIYGVIAYSVAQRTQEIGVRMALGATPRASCGSSLVRAHVCVLWVWHSDGWSFCLNSRSEKMLFGITAADPIAFAGAAIVLGSVAIVASLIPALRAARIDPVNALRQE